MDSEYTVQTWCETTIEGFADAGLQEWIRRKERAWNGLRQSGSPTRELSRTCLISSGETSQIQT